jgi:hypothetical protein
MTLENQRGTGDRQGVAVPIPGRAYDAATGAG